MLATVLALSLSGLVSDAPPRFSATLLSQAETQVAPPQPVLGNTTLKDPQLRLDELRSTPNPGLGGGIAMLVVGIAGLGVGLVFGIYGAAFLLGSSVGGSGLLIGAAFTFLIIAGVALAAGITLTIVGSVLLSKASKARKARSAEIKQLEQEIRQQQWQQRQVAPPPMYPPPANYAPPPPPPLPAPSTFLQTVEPTLLLAEF